MNCHSLNKVATMVIALMLLALASAPEAAPVVEEPEDDPTLQEAVSEDLQALEEQLAKAVTLDQATDELAKALATTRDEVVVRIEQPAIGCCALPPYEFEVREFEGIPLAEIVGPPPAGTAIWLTAKEVTCWFLHDGTELNLISVRSAAR